MRGGVRRAGGYAHAVIAGSLFSGIEGFGLGLLWSGLVSEIVWQVELDPFCQRVLERWFPHADRSVRDVREASAAVLRSVDLLFGGPPCQDVSGAGKGAGLAGARSGLVSEVLRLAEELRPPVVLVENVASGARRWVCPVRGALEALGYRTAALNLGVDDCGAPHRRKRVFILAYSERYVVRLQQGGRRRSRGEGAAELGGGGEGLADADKQGRQGALAAEEQGEGRMLASRGRGHQDAGRAEPAMGARVDGLPGRVVRWPAPPGPQAAWEPPRVLAGVAERAAKLRALGNAVSPVQAYHVGLWARAVLQDAYVSQTRERT